MPYMIESDITEPTKSLFNAIKENNLKLLSALIENKADVNLTDNSQNTLLHGAAIYGRADMVELLIKNKAKIHEKNYLGYTPFHWAAAYGREQAMRVLIEHGADINAKDHTGIKAISLASKLKSWNQVYISLLYFCEEKGYKETVKHLITENKYRQEQNKILEEKIAFRNAELRRTNTVNSSLATSSHLAVSSSPAPAVSKEPEIKRLSPTKITVSLTPSYNNGFKRKRDDNEQLHEYEKENKQYKATSSYLVKKATK